MLVLYKYAEGHETFTQPIFMYWSKVASKIIFPKKGKYTKL